MNLSDEQRFDLLMQIVRNGTSAAELPNIFEALSKLGSVEVEKSEPANAEPLTNAQVKKLIKPEGIVSMIDGKPYKTMKRHITSHGYTVESYRAAYGLPADFPMIAADYSAKRSEYAKAAGLGKVVTPQPKKAKS